MSCPSRLTKREGLEKGDKFGMLTFTGEYIHSSKHKRWICIYKCDCGNIFEARHDNVLKGNPNSCGCQCTATGWRDRVKEYGEMYPFKIILSRVKKQAKVRGISLMIDENDIKAIWDRQNGECYYTGIKLKLPKTFPDFDRNPLVPSLDRINSNLPYQKDNINIVLKVVNCMKLQMSNNEFINKCIQITEYRKEKNHEN